MIKSVKTFVWEEFTVTAADNKGRKYNITADGEHMIIPPESIANDAEYIEISDSKFCARAGDEGCYIIADVEHHGSHICKFRSRSDYEIVTKQDLMPIFGIKKADVFIMGIVEGMKQNFFIAAGIKDGGYYLKLRFEITGFGAYEPIKIRFVTLDSRSDYTAMAKYYREYQLSRGNCVPLRERVKTNPYLRYAVESPEIRIRLAWKPAPPKILEQTPENEPDLHVACTFDRVRDLIDELKHSGVDKAQLCLVGWNKSGHDGRYPQLFPVEEKLGGEEKLRGLIAYAQDNGYRIVCHTNSTDCYSIADTFSEDIVCKERDGSLSVNDEPWSGGRMYRLCPEKAVEYAESDLLRVAGLGFRGLHYIDVMTVVPLRECYDKNHPSDKLNTLARYEKIMRLCHEKFGGFASEGAFDFAAKYLDYAFYVSWSDLDNDFFDEEIPLYEYVYHGIILYNPSTVTVNASIKSSDAVAKMKEYGGRPSFYIYSKFMTGSHIDNWLGSDDLIIDTDEQLRYTVSKIKEVYDDYKNEFQKQYEFWN